MVPSFFGCLKMFDIDTDYQVFSQGFRHVTLRIKMIRIQANLNEWAEDIENQFREPDGVTGWNSVLEV